jgi:hypothetical protein
MFFFSFDGSYFFLFVVLLPWDAFFRILTIRRFQTAHGSSTTTTTTTTKKNEIKKDELLLAVVMRPGFAI